MTRLPQAIESAERLGFATIGASFYHPLPYTDQTLALTPADFDRLFSSSLQELANVRLTRPLTLHVDLGDTVPVAQAAFLSSSWCDPEAWLLDANGSFYNEYTLENGLRLQFRLALWPQMLHEVVRITVDGHLLLALDSLNTRKYAEHALANVRDYGFDVGAAHQAACRAARCEALLAEYGDAVLPRLQAAYAAGQARRSRVEEVACAAH